MSIEKSGIPTQFNQAESSTPTEKAASSEIPRLSKYFASASAICLSSAIVLVCRQLSENTLGYLIQEYLPGFQPTLRTLPYLPSILRLLSSQEFLLGVLVVLVPICWHFVVVLFSEKQWRDKYLPAVCVVQVLGLLVGTVLMQSYPAGPATTGLLIQSPSTVLFLEVFTRTLDMNIFGCVVADLFIHAKS